MSVLPHHYCRRNTALLHDYYRAARKIAQRNEFSVRFKTAFDSSARAIIWRIDDALPTDGPCWGLAAFGQPGVAAVLAILTREFETIMRQAGTVNLKQITASTVNSDLA